ncbi:MAG: histidine kinase [Betaproteobacteria bacterium]|nr:histidine kinase [Betaproteobacteria bacterium]
MSIKQNAYFDGLPDFRNLGTTARILVVVNLTALCAAIYAESNWSGGVGRFVREAAVIEPALLASMVALYALSPTLASMRYLPACGVVLAAVLAITAGIAHAAQPLAAVSNDGGKIVRVLVFTALLVVTLLAYLRLRAKAYSPALTAARLQALQARIRPHFLFNSLNAVLSLIRRDPRRAELALEDLADLFRVIMSDGRKFVRLAEEIALLERYARLEQLRLGERLRIVWDLDSAPQDALLPPLVLQPLLENAVYHGVEPGTGIGEVLLHIEARGQRVLVRLVNPFQPETVQRTGNRMALDNLRERLALFFDAEARLATRISEDRFEVEIEFPYITDRPAGQGETQ